MFFGSVILLFFVFILLSLLVVFGEVVWVYFDVVGDDGQIECGDVLVERYLQEFGRVWGVGFLLQYGFVNRLWGFIGGRKYMNKCYVLVWNVFQGCWNVVSEGCCRCGKFVGVKVVIVFVLVLLGVMVLVLVYVLLSGGMVVGGSVNGEIYLLGGNSLLVNQKVDKFIVNWDFFSVVVGEWVIFNQLSSSLIVLNWVIGIKVSDIQGWIDVNGQVFLVNFNGVFFGCGVQVNVGGLVVFMLDIMDVEFNGNFFRYCFMGFFINGVFNYGGVIIVVEGGSIVLLGVQVDNCGMVLVQMGGVGFGVGSDLMLNFDGNKLFDICVDVGVVNVLVSNGGLFKVDGG